MDISSVSTSSLPHTGSSDGTKIAREERVGKTRPDQVSVSQNQQAVRRETRESMQQRRVEQAERLNETREMQREQLEKLVERLDEFMSSFNKGLAFRLDEDTGRSIITVYEMSSGDIIRQIPEKEMLELAKQLSQHARGLVAEKV
ncbi:MULTISPECIES: flagellar protein FlaG [Salinivibrio]|jgi:flagellar protein FlaG|uniref:flagellar protein FlaG n=2 Tax=Vibrionaceae TaxID=641 RepID=UPI00084C86E1|nr:MULTISPECIES: flagellar protein FlaG [Salinivibrio]ODP99747.1 flagellar biosynthesis protein FlaG [Salinivibrio sp. DV]OOF08065.1 flagellar biosynthesis protein FlaG [Salinivibrio sp. PR5]OOF13599.1 flagellar biosynthesis protein FlaG [Salinivibrio sp. PR932]OOF23936.1 flagellar biosynthesis protein FlaG [Salinivibrio sp. IB574]OOF30504.1 flagellar biosynthesis protein FlaG [Salinivibrio proteolyticus]